MQYILFRSAEDRLLEQIDRDEDIWSIQEKIMINFRSSVKMLREYLQKVFFIPIHVFSNNQIIGKKKFGFFLLIFNSYYYLCTHRQCKISN